MARPALPRLIAGLLPFLLAGAGGAQTLRGKVVESKYATGIDSVRISLKGGAILGYTDSTGRFSFNSGTAVRRAPPGRDPHDLAFALYDLRGVRLGSRHKTVTYPRGPAAKAAAAATVVLDKKGWATREAVVGSGDTTLSLVRDRIKVLIVDGFNNHNWRQTTAIAKSVLEKTGFFTVAVTTSPDQPPTSPAYLSWNPRFRDHEAVLLNVCNINTATSWPDSIRRSLIDFITAGGAAFAFHAAAASFKEWPDYVRLVGFTWADRNYGPSYEILNGFPKEIPAGVGDGTGHGSRFNALIQTAPHPIFRGLSPAWLAYDTEVYTYPRTVAGAWGGVTPMGYAKDETGGSGKTWPVMVLVRQGKGHAFTSLLGHLDNGETYPDRLADWGLHLTLIRSLEWMTRREVQYPVPAGFPTATRTGLNPDRNL